MLTTIKVTDNTGVFGLPVLIENLSDVAAGANKVFLFSDTSMFKVGQRVEINSDAGVEIAKIASISTDVSITVALTALAVDVTTPTLAPFIRPVEFLTPALYVYTDDLHDAEFTYRAVLYGHLLNGKTVNQVLTSTQKTYLETKLIANTASIDLVLMP